MNQLQVDDAISKASRLMNENYMNMLDNMAASYNGKPGNKKVNDLKYLEQQAFGYGSPSNGGYSKQPVQPVHESQQPKRQFSNSVLQEAFATTPPLSGDNFPGAAGMGIGGYQPGASLLTEQRTQQQQYVQPTYVQVPQQTGNIDYNMIKYLVSEAVKESLGEIKQSMLNESTLRGINMPGGNKIQFLDSKGNLYEGQLVLKKKKQ